MGIMIPKEMNFRESEKKPLDLLRDARNDIDELSMKFGFLANNAEVQKIYAQLDGTIFKLENLEPELKKIGEDVSEEKADDDKPLDLAGAGNLLWKMLTDD